ncbi:Abi family protein [Macrococcoides caseolyticum]|uniref:Abi family protein n=1 Tax=Macrococcus caseolyticus (strain JCSC5402) TaxID=458233 RepID=B9EBJ8_MACCJ|nr:Abi family protein [Macrococcus caseolyticus]BAH17609.1 hypothetical protein MCCL_0902 [Macrococcus caseolyticus JCSC5402]
MQIDRFYEELEELLYSKGITENNDIDFLNDLENHGYLNLYSAYKKILNIDSETPINTKDLKFIYTFDFDLQSLVFKYLIQFEISLKERLNYIMCTKFGYAEHEYLAKDNYNTSGKFNVENTINNALLKIRYDEYPIKHFINNRKLVPPWLFLKHIPFGNVQQLYKILKSEEKSSVVNHFITNHSSLTIDLKKEFFDNSLEYIRHYRNVIAHANRFINHNISTDRGNKKSFLKHYFSESILTEYEFNTSLCRNDVNGLFFLIIILTPSKLLRDRFIFELDLLIRQYYEADEGKKIMHISKIPENIVDRLSELNNLTH